MKHDRVVTRIRRPPLASPARHRVLHVHVLCCSRLVLHVHVFVSCVCSRLCVACPRLCVACSRLCVVCVPDSLDMKRRLVCDLVVAADELYHQRLKFSRSMGTPVGFLRERVGKREIGEGVQFVRVSLSV